MYDVDIRGGSEIQFHSRWSKESLSSSGGHILITFPVQCVLDPLEARTSGGINQQRTEDTRH